MIIDTYLVLVVVVSVTNVGSPLFCIQHVDKLLKTKTDQICYWVISTCYETTSLRVYGSRHQVKTLPFGWSTTLLKELCMNQNTNSLSPLLWSSGSKAILSYVITWPIGSLTSPQRPRIVGMACHIMLEPVKFFGQNFVVRFLDQTIEGQKKVSPLVQNPSGNPPPLWHIFGWITTELPTLVTYPVNPPTCTSPDLGNR